jgi:hypothetical protein
MAFSDAKMAFSDAELRGLEINNVSNNIDSFADSILSECRLGRISKPFW